MRFFLCAGSCLALVSTLALYLQKPVIASKAYSLTQQGIAAQTAGNHAVAEVAYRSAIAQEPQNPTNHYNLGNALAAQGKLEAAIAAYQTTLQLDPQNANAHYNLGYWLNEQGQKIEAIAAYRRAIELQPFSADAYYNLSILLDEQGQSTEAEVLRRHAQLLSNGNPGSSEGIYFR